VWQMIRIRLVGDHSALHCGRAVAGHGHA
jgi:hypothetical protein